MVLIDCKKIAADKVNEIKEKVEKLNIKTKLNPCLATILVGENPASQTYINSKIKNCASVGIKSIHHKLSANADKAEIINLINNLNENPEVDAILLQLPLPKKEFEQDCLNAISPFKDADGLHPYNVGKLTLLKSESSLANNNMLIPCTPLGILNILQTNNINISGKNAVIIGRSNLVGKPLASLLLANDATVTIAHSKTKDLKQICKTADILIAAIGRANFVNSDYIKDGATVIDVGINRVEGKIIGDIDFESVKDLDIKLTPVPGGVGKMTIAMLLENTLNAFVKNKNLFEYLNS
jgi:methylenetetrahydrofolate dehydrogenase (NADP+)/methenyltetrahydrofolate cyclohydrolase